MFPAASRRLRAAGLGAVATALLASAPADAAVTIGPPLALPANVAGGCTPAVVFVAPGFPGAPSCTMLGADAAGQWTMQTPRGRWVITRARVRAGANVGPMAFTVIQALRSQATSNQPRPPGTPAVAGIICCTAPFESQVFTPAPNGVTQIATRLPVKNTVDVIGGEQVEVVDYLAISTLAPATSPPVHQAAAGPAASAQTSYIAPAIRAGQQRLADGTALTPTLPLVQGDLEPDADGDGFGDETQDSCPTSAQIRSAPVARAAQCPAAGGPGSTAGPAAAVLAGLRSGTRSLVVRGGRTAATLPIACPAGSTGACAGTVSARTAARIGGRRVTLGARRFTAAAGRTANVRLRLPASVRRALARRRALALDLTITQRTPVAGTTTAQITLRRR